MPKYQYVHRRFKSGLSAMLGFFFPFIVTAAIPVSDHVLEQELGREIDQMENIIPVMERNKTIEIALPYFNRYPQFTELLLGQAVLYFPVIEKILEKYNLPEDLKYLPFFESGFREDAVSPVGARGMWQFMDGTARKYGLTINREMDERLDFIKSTEAAAQFLKTLYEELGDWALVLMAYNGGLYRVKKLVRVNNSDKVRIIMNQMPQESQTYLSKMVAAKLIFKTYKQYGLIPRQPDLSKFYSIRATYQGSLDLNDISREYQVDYTALRQANPHLKYRKISNAGQEVIHVRIPVFESGGSEKIIFRNQAFYIDSEEELNKLAAMLGISSRKIELMNEYFEPVHLQGQMVKIPVPASLYMTLDKEFGPPPVKYLTKDAPMSIPESIHFRLAPMTSHGHQDYLSPKIYYLKPSESLLEVASRLNIPLEKIKHLNPNLDLYQVRRFFIPNLTPEQPAMADAL